MGNDAIRSARNISQTVAPRHRASWRDAVFGALAPSASRDEVMRTLRRELEEDPDAEEQT
jgi:hypothetical protein